MKKYFLLFLLIIAPLFINTINACENNAKLILLEEKHYEIGKNQSTAHKLIVEIDFENYYSDDDIFSFSINSSQILADSHLQKKFFTINPTTGEIYNVEHFLGSDYQNIILTTVKNFK